MQKDKKMKMNVNDLPSIYVQKDVQDRRCTSTMYVGCTDDVQKQQHQHQSFMISRAQVYKARHTAVAACNECKCEWR